MDYKLFPKTVNQKEVFGLSAKAVIPIRILCKNFES